MNKIIVFAALSFLSVLSSGKVFGATEFSILPVVPQGETTAAVQVMSASSNGYVLCKINTEDDGMAKLGLFHPEQGFNPMSEVAEGAIGMVNNSGVVAGVIGKSSNPWVIQPAKAFVFDSTTNGFELLDNVGIKKGYITSLLGMSDSGLLLLGYIDESKRVPLSKTMIYDTRTKKSDLNVPEGLYNIKMDKNGLVFGTTIVGGAVYKSSLLGESEVEKLDFIPVGSNDRGDICGYNLFARNTTTATVLLHNGGIADIPLLEESSSEGAVMAVCGINNSGQLFGTAAVNPYPYDDNAFFYDPAEGISHLFGGPGQHLWPVDMNQAGQIVGSVEREDEGDEPLRSLFIWDKEGGLQDLNSRIPAGSGWSKLERAVRITEDGAIIGEGDFLGQKCGFIMTP